MANSSAHDKNPTACDTLPWQLLESLKGQTLKTLVQTREFTILEVSQYAVKLRRKETRTTAHVERLEFQKAFALLMDKGAVSIGEIGEFSARGSSYIAAILTQLPDIVWEKGQLRLQACTSRSQQSPELTRSQPSPDTTRLQPPPETRQRSAALGAAKHTSFDAVWAQQSDDVLAYWRKLDPRAQKDIIALTLSDTAMLVRNLGCCESPLEQILSAHLLSAGRMVSLVGDFTLEPQHEVQTPSGLYRVDILVKGQVDGNPVLLAVECDGHTYHDRTKEQAARDRQRDRALKLAGYEVVRFAGSEILEDPEGCALEVFGQMLALAGRTPSSVSS